MARGLQLFKDTVRPLLEKHCLECHGGESIKGGFDLSRRETMMNSGFVEDAAADSQLFLVISHDEEPFMPHRQDKLPDAAIDAIGQWIDWGAPYDRPLVEGTLITREAGYEITDRDRTFWSFQDLAVVDPPPPDPNSPWIDWPATDVDRFVLANLEVNGLGPNDAAGKRTLIRRLYFDLIGLPPSPDEIETFLADEGADAYERMVDRLLESPHFGERWARYWLDVARFAESSGFEHDSDRPHAWHYRDFVIRAFNADMPYDQFVRWQLAGDELRPDEPDALKATGFLAAGVFPTQLTEVEFERTRYDEMDDMAMTTGVALLGLSIGCARCHDHKFDPIPTHDYYRFVSAFTKTIRTEIDVVVDGESGKVMVGADGFAKMNHHANGRGYPHFYPQTHVLLRGDVDQKLEVAEPGFLQVLMRHEQTADAWRVDPPADWQRSSFDRASLAEWITDAEHGAGHLAARVIVNRLWQHHLGRGLVATPNDFGLQGAPPTHPQLLDWLANDLIQNGWRLKRLHKLIVMSSVYRQSSHWDETKSALDIDNRWLWRFTPRRLEAEAIRDAMLVVSGTLDDTMFGPGTLDPASPRRSVYFTIKRSRLIPMMLLFDWPEHLVSIGRRVTTTTAPQSLLLMNDPNIRQLATRFAKRCVESAPGEDRAAPIQFGYRVALGRAPAEDDLERAIQFLGAQASIYRDSGNADADMSAMVDFCLSLMSMNEFLYVE